MVAALLSVLFAAGPIDDAKLLAGLDDDFQQLVVRDPQCEQLREAARRLEETNRNTHWTSYKRAIEIVRQPRSKAGIPLPMSYMRRHAGTGKRSMSGSSVALNLLTGRISPDLEKQIADRRTPTLEAVDRWVAE